MIYFERIKKRAENGNFDSMLTMSDIYHYFHDDEEALRWFNKAVESAQERDEVAMVGFAYCRNGDDDDFVGKDYDEAKKWYKLAIESDDYNTSQKADLTAKMIGLDVKLGDEYADSDKEKALEFYKLASEGELDPDYEDVYALKKLVSEGVDPDYEDVYALKVKAMRKIAEIYDEAGDYANAVEWYKKFAEDEDGDIILYNLDKYYTIGEDVVRHIAERLAELYYELGQKEQSVKYYNKLKFQHDDDDYREKVTSISCEIAAECEDNTETVKWYQFSMDYGEETDEAAEKISEFAEKGNAYAQCLMADRFMSNSEYKQALDWYQKAVKSNCRAWAYYGIGMIALKGLKDEGKAAKYFCESLKSRENSLSNLHKDLYKASYVDFWHDTYKGKALSKLLDIVRNEQKSPVLPHYAETLFMELISTESEILEQVKDNFEYSSGEDSAIFQNMLGIIYSEDLGGVDVDFEEAASWYRKAAENGHVEAMYALAEMYEEGRGVEQDIDEAVKWYREASEKGHLTAKTMLERLTGVEEEEAQEISSETDIDDTDTDSEEEDEEEAEDDDVKMDEEELRQAMKAEAVERMKLLGLPEKIINDFQEKSAIYISESVKFGEINEVYKIDDDNTLLDDIKDFEKDYDGSLVYHVIRNYNDYHELIFDSFLFVFPNPSEWDYAKRVFKNKKILMDVYVLNREIPAFSECGEILVEAKDGGLVKMS